MTHEEIYEKFRIPPWLIVKILSKTDYPDFEAVTSLYPETERVIEREKDWIIAFDFIPY